MENDYTRAQEKMQNIYDELDGIDVVDSDIESSVDDLLKDLEYVIQELEIRGNS